MNSYQDVQNKISQWSTMGLTKSELVVLIAEACMEWPYVWGGIGNKCTGSNRISYANRSACPEAEAKLIISQCQVCSGRKASCEGCRWYPGGSCTLVGFAASRDSACRCRSYQPMEHEQQLDRKRHNRSDAQYCLLSVYAESEGSQDDGTHRIPHRQRDYYSLLRRGEAWKDYRQGMDALCHSGRIEWGCSCYETYTENRVYRGICG